MAAEVQPRSQVRLPSGPSPVTAEQRYWSSFKNQRSHTSTAEWPISHISFPGGGATSASAVAATRTNDLFAVTSGPRVEIYSIRRREPVKTLGRFDSEAFGAEIRPDGRVLVAGENSGKMQVFDVAGGSRAAVLRTWHVHKQPVWVTKWDPASLTTLMSASDDKTVRLWNLPSNEPTATLHGHDDYVRSGTFLPGGNGNLLASGSYDQTVRVWDARAPGKSVLTIKHRDPVEAVLALPSGTGIVAAAGNSISVVDLVAAKTLLVSTNHQKTVTSLCLASHGRRVVSGGLDGHVKVFDVTNFNVVASSKYPSPILSLAVITAGHNHDDRHLAVGMQSGVLSLRTRLTGSAAERDRERAAEQAALEAGPAVVATYDGRIAQRKRDALSARTMAALGGEVDAVVDTDARAGSSRKRKREKQWQKDLRHGRHAAALDAVLDMGAADYQCLTALTVVTALRHRSSLRDALEGRDEESVLPILKWTTKYLMDPDFRPACVDISLHLIDLYAEYLGSRTEYPGSSTELTNAFKSLIVKVRQEVDKAQCAVVTNGMLESIMMGAVE